MPTLPTTSAQITADWLNEVLPDEQRGGARIVTVEPAVIGEGVGFLGEVARLTLGYDDPANGSVRSLISKMPTDNEGFKSLGMMLGLYAKESGFYRDAAHHMQVRVPGCYANLVDDDNNFVLLLEDLAPMRPGNQLASCTLDEAKMALAEVAKIHAHWWEHDRLPEFESWLPGTDGPAFEVFKGGFLGGVEKFHSDFAHYVSDDVVALVDRIAADYDSMTANGPGRSPHTLVHGDFRLDNLMFDDSSTPPSIAILDFQLPFRANPLWDVVYFMAGSFTPEWRRTHQDELLGGYHAALVAGGVTNYSLEDCNTDYRAAGLVLTGYLVTGAADIDLSTIDDRGRRLIEMLFTGYGVAIDDLGSAEFMPT